MAKSFEEVFARIEKKLATTLRDLPSLIGEEVVNFTLDNFQDQGWNGDSLEPWKPRKNPTAWGKKDDPSRALLVKTGKLRRSIRVSKLEESSVTITAGGADVPYARVHNEGFSGEVVQHVQEFERRTKNLKNVKVKAHTRRFMQHIPKRQFLGGTEQSSVLRSRIRDVARKEFQKIFNT